MARLPIIIHPDAVLRKVAAPVTDITPDIVELLDNMLETMYAAPGIGLAAPQVGVSKRVVVIDIEGGREGESRNPLRMVNPEIISISAETTPLEEGCLSLPDMNVEVIRPAIVVARYMDEKGVTQEIEAGDLLAKCIQHEIDHLDGKLIFDYLSPLKRNIALRRYNKNQRFGE